MRKIAFWPILFVLGLFMLSLTASLALAQLAPLHPGDALFPIQFKAEQMLVGLTADPGDRAKTLMDLLERRTADLLAANASPETLVEFDQALAHALQSLSAAPEHNAADLRSRAMTVLARAHAALDQLDGAVEAVHAQ